MSKKPEAKIETITPDRAERDLEAAVGKNYRPLDEHRAEHLAVVIRNGDWELNGESIKYNGDGKLIDGQTRLRAVILAKKSIETLVVYGVSSDRNIDTGQSRKFIHLLSRMGESNCKDLAGTLGYLWRQLHHTGFVSTGVYSVPHSELLRLLKKEPTVRESVATVLSLLPRTIGRHSMFAAFYHFAVAKDEDLAKWFIERLGSAVELKEGEPVLILRRRLENDRERKMRLTRRELLALTIIAWNYTRQGRQIQQLKWTSSGPSAQPFPEIE